MLRFDTYVFSYKNMQWHSAKSKERPDHMDTCICVLPRNKGIITTFYDKEKDQFITKDDYGDYYSIIEIKAWVTEYELISDCKESLKSNRINQGGKENGAIL